MKNIAKLLGIATLTCSAAAFSASFASADTDKDGTLDKTEVKALPGVAKNFDAIDTDKDGTIDKTELAVYNAMKADKDKDGTLDRKEVHNKKLKAAFDRIDTDKDGTLDAKELSAYYGAK